MKSKLNTPLFNSRRFIVPNLIVIYAFALIVISCPDAIASTQMHTVQLGVFSTLEAAKKQYDFIGENLQPQMKSELRVEKVSEYFIVRVGRYLDYQTSERLLRAVRPIIKDAFIVKEHTAKSGVIILPASLPKTAQTKGAFTIQIGVFDLLKEAEIEFFSFFGVVDKAVIEGLRIENDGRLNYVRLGYYDSMVAASSQLKKIKQLKKNAFVARIQRGTQTILYSYSKNRIRKSESLNSFAAVTTMSSSNMKTDGKETNDADVNLASKQTERINKEMPLLLKNKEYKKGIDMVEKAISKWPKNPDLYSWYGTLLISDSRHENALEQFKKAVAIAPAEPKYHNGTGYSYAYIHMNAARLSIQSFKKALSLDPNNIDALEGLGTVYASIGEKRSAYRIYVDLTSKDKLAADRLHSFISSEIDWGTNER